MEKRCIRANDILTMYHGKNIRYRLTAVISPNYRFTDINVKRQSIHSKNKIELYIETGNLDRSRKKTAR